MTEKLSPKDKKTIVLIGMMGAGKTTTGFNLAQRLNLKFIDSDKEIEKIENKSIIEIFSERGEKYFQELEKKIINDILDNEKPQILSIGGNTYDDEEIRDSIKNKAISVFLDVEYDVLLDRVKRKNTRPLLENGDKAEILREIYDKKIPIYKNADIVINTTYLSRETSINVTIKMISQYIRDNEVL
jgi:shikimate kinase